MTKTLAPAMPETDAAIVIAGQSEYPFPCAAP